MRFIFSKIKWVYIKKFFIITGSVTGIYLVIATAVTLTLMAADSRLFNSLRPSEIFFGDTEAEEETEDGEEIPEPVSPTPTPQDDDGFFKAPARTNFLFIGIDNFGLTDALIVGCFYRDSCEIRFMSIPRDLYTRLPEHRLTQMRNDGRRPPSYLKINELRNYGGQENGTSYLAGQLAEMLGLSAPFMYYAEINLKGFRDVVDALGGVWMEVPSVINGGLYYDDSENGLLINLSAGMQLIKGEEAEQLIRFRSYPSGDIGRKAVQSEFMKQLFRQALRRENLMNDPVALINALIKHVRTNITFDIMNYAPFASKLSGDKIFSFTFPGYENAGPDGRSYVFVDEKALPEAIREVFFAEQTSEADVEYENGDEPKIIEPKPSALLRIQILNGGRVAGLASSFADKLASEGYNVVDINAFQGTKVNATRILIAQDGTARDLLPYFHHAEIETSDSIPDGYDIVIIIGLGEG